MLNKFFLSIVILYFGVTNCRVIQAQTLSDSAILERALKYNNSDPVDSMLDSWYLQSINKHHKQLENDTIKFVYKVYNRFMKDYLHKEMEGKEKNAKETFPIEGNYFFIQNEIHYLFIDSISFEDLHYFFNTLFQHYKLRFYRYRFKDLLFSKIRNSYKDNTRKLISPFYPDIKDIFKKNDPKPIYIERYHRHKTLVNFLGYGILTSSVRYNRIEDSTKLNKRKYFLSSILGFDKEKIRSYFAYPVIPQVRNIIIDSKMRYAIVEYFVGPIRNVNMAFYPVKLIHWLDSGHYGLPLSWQAFTY